MTTTITKTTKQGSIECLAGAAVSAGLSPPKVDKALASFRAELDDAERAIAEREAELVELVESMSELRAKRDAVGWFAADVRREEAEAELAAARRDRARLIVLAADALQRAAIDVDSTVKAERLARLAEVAAESEELRRQLLVLGQEHQRLGNFTRELQFLQETSVRVRQALEPIVEGAS